MSHMPYVSGMAAVDPLQLYTLSQQFVLAQ